MSIYFYGCISMDGYLADKNHNLDWLHQSGTTDETNFDEFYNSVDITIMGKRTFSEIENLQDSMPIYPKTENYVFTHAETLSLKNFTPVSGDIVDFVKGLDKNKNIWIVGGNTILSPLLENDMIDNIILQIAPVLLGDGIPLFTQKEKLMRFTLKEIKKYGQFAELIYSKT